MKKSISFIGAFLLGSAAFAQVSKTDTTKNPVRKVMASDVKNLPVADEPAAKNKEIKGSVTQKGRENRMLQKGREHRTVVDSAAKVN